MIGIASGGASLGLSIDSQNCFFSVKVKSFSCIAAPVVVSVTVTVPVFSLEVYERVDVGSLVGFCMPEISFFFSKIT